VTDDYSGYYFCQRCGSKIWYTLVKAEKIIAKYGLIFCDKCLFKNRNGVKNWQKRKS